MTDRPIPAQDRAVAVDPALVAVAWSAMGGTSPPTPHQEATLRRVIAAVLTADRNRARTATARAVLTEMRDRRRQDDPRVALFGREYAAGASFPDLSRRYGVSYRTARRLVMASGVPIRPRGTRPPKPEGGSR